jgi:hypothetical protein
VLNIGSGDSQLLLLSTDLHAQVPEVKEVIPVLNTGSGDSQFLHLSTDLHAQVPKVNEVIPMIIIGGWRPPPPKY